MTTLTYICTTPKGDKITVDTYFKALQIKEAGGSYVRSYTKVEEPFKVKPDRFEKLKEKGVIKF